MNPVLQRMLLSPRGFPSKGLKVLFLPYRQSSGDQVIYDYSGQNTNATNGSTSGVDTNDASIADNGLLFSTDDYCSFDVAKLPQGDTDFTAIVAVKPSQNNAGIALSWGLNAALSVPHIWLKTSQITAEVGGGGNLVTMDYAYSTSEVLFLVFRYNYWRREISLTRGKNLQEVRANLASPLTIRDTDAVLGAYVSKSTYFNGHIYLAAVANHYYTNIELSQAYSWAKHELGARGIAL